jgi:DNA-binding transcriptional regulator YbjK
LSERARPELINSKDNQYISEYFEQLDQLILMAKTIAHEKESLLLWEKARAAVKRDNSLNRADGGSDHKAEAAQQSMEELLQSLVVLARKINLTPEILEHRREARRQAVDKWSRFHQANIIFGLIFVFATVVFFAAHLLIYNSLIFPWAVLAILILIQIGITTAFAFKSDSKNRRRQ